jgi:hypothetical protein
VQVLHEFLKTGSADKVPARVSVPAPKLRVPASPPPGK